MCHWDDIRVIKYDIVLSTILDGCGLPIFTLVSLDSGGEYRRAHLNRGHYDLLSDQSATGENVRPAGVSVIDRRGGLPLVADELSLGSSLMPVIDPPTSPLSHGVKHDELESKYTGPLLPVEKHAHPPRSPGGDHTVDFVGPLGLHNVTDHVVDLELV